MNNDKPLSVVQSLNTPIATVAKAARELLENGDHFPNLRVGDILVWKSAHLCNVFSPGPDDPTVVTSILNNGYGMEKSYMDNGDEMRTFAHCWGLTKTKEAEAYQEWMVDVRRMRVVGNIYDGEKK